MKATILSGTLNTVDRTVDLIIQFSTDSDTALYRKTLSMSADQFSKDATIDRLRDMLTLEILSNSIYPVTQDDIDTVIDITIRIPE